MNTWYTNLFFLLGNPMHVITTFQNWARNERLIHSIKTAFACLIGLFMASYIHLQAMQWIVITTLVVMCAQINVGSVIQKSSMRFLGTLAGSVLAILTLKIFGNDFVISISVVLIAAMIFSFIATSTKSYNESGTLGAVTVTIILLSPNPSVLLGFERFLEISLGILIAAIVSQFVLPIHASYHLRRNQSNTISKIRLFYLNLFASTSSEDNQNALSNLDEEIVKSLITQRKLAGEARREKIGKSFNLDYFRQSLWCEKELIRSIIFMFYAHQKIIDLPVMRGSISLLEKFHQEISNTLENISFSIGKNETPKDVSILALPELKQSLINIIELNQDQKITMDAFIFCGEILVDRLTTLVGLLKNTLT